MVWSFLSARWPVGSLALTLSLFPSVLVDETTEEYEDILWIWAVCFSPDGKLLATAVGDGVIRVSSRTFVLAIAITDHHLRTEYSTWDNFWCS